MKTIKKVFLIGLLAGVFVLFTACAGANSSGTFSPASAASAASVEASSSAAVSPSETKTPVPLPSVETTKNVDHKPLLEESDKDIYQGGASWIVGENLKAGEYILLSETPQDEARVYVSSDKEGKDVLFDIKFKNSFYVVLQDGQKISMKSCISFPSDQYAPQESSDGKFINGMYKVGKDIDPGQYTVTPDGDGAKYTVYVKPGETVKSEKDSLSENETVDLAAGDYIFLYNCSLTK
jgi:hypothetical protein